MTAILLTIITILLAVSFIKKHFIFFLFVCLVFFYELSGPILYTGVFGDEVVSAQQHLLENISNQSIYSFTLSLYLFLGVFCFSYLFFNLIFKKHKKYHFSYTSRLNNKNEYINPFLIGLFVLICGIISYLKNAGETRLLDYGLEGTIGGLPVTPAFSYGNLLLIVLIITIYQLIINKKYIYSGLLILMAIPLIREIFISSRRQYFAPSILALIFLLGNTPKIRKKGLWLATILIGSLSLLGAQYWVRNDFTVGSSATGIFEAIVAPQLGEFVAVGTTSIKSWNNYVIFNGNCTWGLHWGFHLLDSIPFIKAGTFMFPIYSNQMLETYKSLAPWGGLSIYADTILAGGLWGIIILGIISSFFLAIAHNFLSQIRIMQHNWISSHQLYLLSISATILLKYRSGIGDMIQTFVSFSILFLFLIALNKLIPNLRVPQ